MQAAWSKVVVMALALAAASGTARAADGGTGSDELARPAGAYFLAGGGVIGFTDTAARDRYDVGGTWDLRVGFGNRFYLGGEAAYVGSARTPDASGPDLLTNGGEAVLRLQVPYQSGRWLVEPFAFGGIGWTRASLRDAPPGVKDSDDVGVVPFGAGLTLAYDRFLVDARFTWRAAFGEDLPIGDAGGTPDLDQWGVTTSVGYEF